MYPYNLILKDSDAENQGQTRVTEILQEPQMVFILEQLLKKVIPL